MPKMHSQTWCSNQDYQCDFVGLNWLNIGKWYQNNTPTAVFAVNVDVLQCQIKLGLDIDSGP